MFVYLSKLLDLSKYKQPATFFFLLFSLRIATINGDGDGDGDAL